MLDQMDISDEMFKSDQQISERMSTQMEQLSQRDSSGELNDAMRLVLCVFCDTGNV